MPKSLLSAAGLLLWLSGGLACTESTPSPVNDARTSKTSAGLEELQCFSDQEREICLQPTGRPDPLVVYVDGTPVVFVGEWTQNGKRVPNLKGHLGGEDGPLFATGPNGALRIQCPKGIRQYFKGPRKRIEDASEHPAPEQSENPCRLLGL